MPNGLCVLEFLRFSPENGGMRIEGPKPASELKKADKARKTGGSSGVFGALLGDETEAPEAARTMGGIMGVGSLLAAQSAEDPTERKAKKKMMERADNVLNALDDVQNGLLRGTLSMSQMQQVRNTLSVNREKIMDSNLLGILDEVELRAQVELAKMEMAKDKKA